MSVFCENCGNEIDDPGGDLENFTCGYCGKGPLRRVPEPASSGSIVGAGLGAAIGTASFGPVGAIIGAGLGYFIGNQWREKK